MASDPAELLKDDMRWAVEAELSWHDGDVRATIADLIMDRQFLRQQLELANFAGSKFFSQKWQSLRQ